MEQKYNTKKTVINLVFSKLLYSKSVFVSTLLLFSLAFFLLQSVTIMIESLLATTQNKRFEQYGEWEYAVSGIQPFTIDDPGFALEGDISIYGQFSPIEDSERFYPFGVYDNNAKELSKIKLLQGQLPKEKNEIALEMETMRLLHIPYELGQEVTFLVTTLNLKVEDKEKGALTYIYQVNPCTFKVSGIIQSYSSGWTDMILSEIKLPAFIISDRYAEEFKNNSDLCNIKLLKNTSSMEKNQWMEAMNSRVSSLGKADNYTTFMENENAYPKAGDSKNNYDQLLVTLYCAVLLISVCILFLTIIRLIQNQADTIRIFFLMGARSAYVRSFLICQCIVCLLIALPVGIILAYGASSIGIFLLDKVSDETLVLSISLSGILFSGLLSLVCCVLASLFPILFSSRLRYISLKQKICNRKKGKLVQSHAKKHRKRSLLQITFRSFFETPVKNIIFILFLGIYLMSSFILVSNAEASFHSYRNQAEMDIDFSIHALNISKEKVELLAQSSSILEVYALKKAGFVLSFDLEPSHKNLFQNEYFLLAKQRYAEMEKLLKYQEQECYSNVMAIPSSVYWNHILSKEFELSQKEMEDFFSGTSAIIFLPDIYNSGNDRYQAVGFQEGEIPSQLKVLTQTFIQEGDRVRLSYVDQSTEEKVRETKEIEISKVKTVYYNPESIYGNFPVAPFSMIISDTLMTSFQTYKERDSYQQIVVKADKSATKESVDKVIFEVSTGVPESGITDYRILKETAFQNMVLQLTSILFLLLVLTVVLILAFYYMTVLEANYAKERVNLFVLLGMEEGSVLFCNFIKGVIRFGLCIFTALVFYFGYCFLSAALTSFTEGIYSIPFLFFGKIEATNWTMVMFMFVLFLPFLIGLSLLPSKKLLKQKKR